MVRQRSAKPLFTGSNPVAASILNIYDDFAGVAELADAHDSKSCSFGSVGSTPTTGTSRQHAKAVKSRLSTVHVEGLFLFSRDG